MNAALRAVLATATLFVGLLTGCAGTSAAPLVPGGDVLVESGDGATSLDAVLDAARDARVVCFGESHDDRDHHLLQLRVLQAMAESDAGPLMLGMEMFQHPYQEPLDRYVAGEIDEAEMLRRTEYFSRWNFDYTLYAPLWRFCREGGIRVVGLNAPRDVVRQIGRQGLDSLDVEQRALIADEIDLTVESHRERILAVFSGGTHPMPTERLERMYQAQTTWDETMAESAADALDAAGPTSRMLVLAGSYHIQQYDGIPGRIARRIPGLDPLVIVARDERQRPGTSEEVAALAHYLLVPVDDRARLGVGFEEETLTVTAVAPGSAAERAGVQVGDTIRALNGTPAADLVDLRVVLDPVPLGSTGSVTVERDGVLIELAVEWIQAPRPRMPGMPTR